ncbi:hypothetical protein [Luteipulveratus halotolerans]|uniref:Uncharacterized protein n=1 Tax=Luteipulveratus halotolerans TaxID=1631356 RepID=A0A0L6CKC3_9MICO|nr:hypothetical protein [Luteipulveratus halotolerans]KNX38065.1 hypothetical protein VV01_14405 [Luteipulveratus halotolerans]
MADLRAPSHMVVIAGPVDSTYCTDDPSFIHLTPAGTGPGRENAWQISVDRRDAMSLLRALVEAMDMEDFHPGSSPGAALSTTSSLKRE